MKTLFLIFSIFLTVPGFSQKLHKFEKIDYQPLTLNPTIFDPEADSTIVFIEFLQDSVNNIYEADEEAKYSSIGKSEIFEQVFAVGLIGDFRISHNKISVIIKTHHENGQVKTFIYTKKIDKLNYYDDFKWATYGIKGVYYYEYDRRIVKPNITMKCSI